LRGVRTGVIVCGANIDCESFCRYLKRGDEELRSPSLPSAAAR